MKLLHLFQHWMGDPRGSEVIADVWVFSCPTVSSLPSIDREKKKI